MSDLLSKVIPIEAKIVVRCKKSALETIRTVTDETALNYAFLVLCLIATIENRDGIIAIQAEQLHSTVATMVGDTEVMQVAEAEILRLRQESEELGTALTESQQESEKERGKLACLSAEVEYIASETGTMCLPNGDYIREALTKAISQYGVPA